jgi:hypothetical protein
MKFIILVSNLKEISPSVFPGKKQYIKNYDAILLLKYDSFNFYTKLAESSFLCRFRIESINVFVQFHNSICAMCFLHQQTISHMRKRFPE